jgi:tetratricopeptide (TPR) repeat protein
VLEPLLKFKHDYPLYHLLAMAYTQKEQLDKAREHFEEAVRLNPRSGTDYEHLANIYLAQKRFAKAAEAYEKAGGLGVDSAVYHFKLASVYFNLRNYLGVVTVAEVLGGKAGEIKNDLYLLEPAPITGADGAPAVANAPAGMRPPVPPSGPAKKDLFYVAGPKSAIYQAAKAQQMGVDMPQIRFLEANTWLSARRYAKADSLYKALEGKLEKADQGLFWFYWAQTALGLDDLDNYLSRLNKAIEAEPDVYKPTLADAYMTIANRYQARGDAKKYIEFVARAVETNPLSASLHLVLGDAYWQASQGKLAIEQYKLVLELEPDHSQRVRLLNRIRGEQDVPPAPTARTGAGQ